MNHLSVRVYSNGKYISNIVREEDLKSHISYNTIFRFGTGLFIDGKCVHQGYLSGEQVKNWTKRISEMKINLTNNTIPYN